MSLDALKPTKARRFSIIAALLAVVAMLAITVQTSEEADAAHRPQWTVYPILFYGNNQTLDSTWSSNLERKMEQVQAWYKEQLSGETFTLGSTITMQGQHSWQYYRNAADPWTTMWNEIASRGEHVSQTGYIYFLAMAFRGPALGQGASDYSWGLATHGDPVFDHYQRPDDCLADWNCPYTQSTGGITHELAHALSIDPHDPCDPGWTCLLNFWDWPLTSLTANQRSQLLNNSQFIAPISGTVPNDPTNLVLTSGSGNAIIGCYNDNSTNEEYFYQYIEQWNSGETRPSIYRVNSYSGTGNRCDNRYGWWSTNAYSWTAYHLKVWGQGSGGNSAKADSDPFWKYRSMRPRPASPTNAYTFGQAEGYTGIWICWYDQATNEDGFFITQHYVPDPNPLEPEATYFRVPQTNGPPAWTCQWTDVAHSGNYYYEVAAIRGPASSTTCETVQCLDQPYPLTSGIEYGVPTSTQ